MDHSEVTRFTRFWTQSQTTVFAVISSSITNFADAEDVLQKVSAVAVHKFADFDPDGDLNAFLGWVITIARFEILTHLRKTSSDRHQYIAESLGQIVDAFTEIAPEVDDRKRALAICMQQMQGRARTILEKKYADGLKTAAIADSLGLTPNNVSVALNRAYRKLRQCVDGRLALDGGQS